MTRHVRAAFDAEGVFVYQAFRPEIAEEAVRLGTFGRGFNLQRMTWIKPSFGWMLYRSGYATKHRQERILRIKLTHEGFRTILGRAVPTTFDPRRFASQAEWGATLARTEVRMQWDPDRDLALRKLDRRAIQLGLSGRTVVQYAREWIVGVEDVTALARQLAAPPMGQERPTVPQERVYPVSAELASILGADPSDEAPAEPSADAVQAQDEAFIADIVAHPEDPALRLIYADWLEDHDELRAAFLRREAERLALPPDDPRMPDLADELLSLREAIDPDWVARLDRTRIERCPLKFKPPCPQRWEQLRVLDQPDVRFCDACQKPVFHCGTLAEARAHKIRGECVAVDSRLARTERDLAATWIKDDEIVPISDEFRIGERS